MLCFNLSLKVTDRAQPWSGIFGMSHCSMETASPLPEPAALVSTPVARIYLYRAEGFVAQEAYLLERGRKLI